MSLTGLRAPRKSRKPSKNVSERMSTTVPKKTPKPATEQMSTTLPKEYDDSSLKAGKKAFADANEAVLALEKENAQTNAESA